jgi:hypothetical protein
MNGTSNKGRRTLTEELEIAASDLVDRVKEFVKEGNVRRLVIRKPNGEPLIEVSLTAGIAVGGVMTSRIS